VRWLILFLVRQNQWKFCALFVLPALVATVEFADPLPCAARTTLRSVSCILSMALICSAVHARLDGTHDSSNLLGADEALTLHSSSSCQRAEAGGRISSQQPGWWLPD